MRKFKGLMLQARIIQIRNPSGLGFGSLDCQIKLKFFFSVLVPKLYQPRKISKNGKSWSWRAAIFVHRLQRLRFMPYGSAQIFVICGNQFLVGSGKTSLTSTLFLIMSICWVSSSKCELFATVARFVWHRKSKI